ncbi:MAG: hypothetical protein IJ773_13990, partial [Lachnospiraceae bacterium]|nr:hypothetical protein [Lachnospiraceae bacterium]
YSLHDTSRILGFYQLYRVSNYPTLLEVSFLVKGFLATGYSIQEAVTSLKYFQKRLQTRKYML